MNNLDTMNGVDSYAATTPKLLSRLEAAAWLGISERTLYSLTKVGAIRVVRIGTRKLYDPHDLAAFAEASKSQRGQVRYLTCTQVSGKESQCATSRQI